MYRLRRLYLDSIGVPDNRFSDLTVDLVDGAGEPVDSIVWLRNGAGKTTMLSLLLALVLPARPDFLATRTKKRTLEDLVQGGDTAHVVAEWVDPHGQVLLTGAVYEWDGRVRPRDYNSPVGRQRFRRSWWCVHPDPAVEGSRLEELPFTRRSKGAVDRTAFRNHIRDLTSRGVNATIVDDNIGDWHNALRERRFDPELFSYFAEVNATEGGIDALFSAIDSPAKFVQYLLRFVGDERRARPVRELLAENAVEIAKRPVYLRQREFCAEALPRLRSLGEAHAKVVETAQQRKEVRERASAYKRALLDAVDVAVEAATTDRARHSALEADAVELRRVTDNLRRQRDEYGRLAAVFRVAGAKEGVARAEAGVAAAQLEADAWPSVDILLALAEAKALLAERDDAVVVAAAGAEPLMAQVARAAERVAGALRGAIERADARLVELEAAVGVAEAEVEAAFGRRTEATNHVAALEAERTSLSQAIAKAEERRAGAERDGLVERDESIAAAIGRTEDTAAQVARSIEELETTLAAIPDRRTEANDTLHAARQLARETEAARRDLDAELERIEQAAAVLDADHRLRDLAQAADICVLDEAGDLLASLADAVAAAEAEALALRAELAADERALHALAVDGLLPPRVAVERVVAALGDAGISAHPGWRYLAAHEPPARHRELIARHPHLVDGVVVYGDPRIAAATIDGLDVDELVAIAPASTLVGDSGETVVVVGPAPAQHDPAAGEAERDRRRDAADARAGRVAQLEERRRTDVALADALRSLVDRVGPDGIGARRDELGRAEAEATAAAEVETAAEGAVNALSEEEQSLLRRLSGLTEDRGRIGARLERLQALVDDERDLIGPGRARLASIPLLVERAREAAERAEGDQERAGAERERLLEQVRGLRPARRAWAQRLEVLGVEAIGTDVDVEIAEAALAEAEALLRERFPEGELRRAVDEAKKAVSAAAGRLQDRSDNVVTRARELLAGTAGNAELRRDAERAARDALTETSARLGEAGVELKSAKAELERATPSDRVRHGDVPTEPTDRDEALRLAADADEQAGISQLQLGDLERQRDKAKADAEAADIRAGMLRDQANSLRGLEPADAAAGNVPADADDVRAEVDRIARELEGAENAYNSAATGRSQRIDQLRNWADGDRFREVAEDEHGQAVRQLRDRFRGDDVVDRVAPQAEELADELTSRSRAITQQLEQVEVHKRNVVRRLADLVEDALGDLSRASSLSELPEGIGPWAGLRFLVVEPRQRPNREQVVVRVADLVDTMVGAGKVELDAVELLWRAVDAAVAGGFRATILKPAPDQPTGRTPVEDMRKWSGGENLTASLVLFCVMAKLRAEKRTGARAGATGGVVPLDNPLGKANYLPFLELQRKVAAANGVQLVFWTGIGDIGAVTAFPRIAAMHKRPSATAPGRAYVRNDEAGSRRARAADTQVVEVANALRRS